MLKIPGTLALSLAVFGCASPGTKVAPAQAQSFERGKTTYTEIVVRLGRPNIDSTADDGTRVAVYSRAGYTFTFDGNGVLQKADTMPSLASAAPN